MRWTDDDWLILDNGTTLPDVTVPAPDLPEYRFPERPAVDDFDSPVLDLEWQS